MGINLNDLGWGRRRYWNNPEVPEPIGKLKIRGFYNNRGESYLLARGSISAVSYYFETEREEDANHRS
jgi:hypothetical protein